MNVQRGAPAPLPAERRLPACAGMHETETLTAPPTDAENPVVLSADKDDLSFRRSAPGATEESVRGRRAPFKLLIDCAAPARSLRLPHLDLELAEPPNEALVEGGHHT